MQYAIIISPRPKCKTCGTFMREWNAFADTHEHIECTANRISDAIISIVKKQLEQPTEEQP